MVNWSIFDGVAPQMTSVEVLAFDLHRSNVKNAQNVKYTRGIRDNGYLGH